MSGIVRALKSVAARRSAQTVVEAAPPPYSTPSILRFILETLITISHCVPSPVKSTHAAFLEEKSNSEIIFLASVLVAVLFFVVVLPTRDAFSALKDEKQEQRHRDQHIQDRNRFPSSSSLMKVYKPGVGVVEMDVREIAEMTSLRRSSDGSSCSNSSDRNLFPIEESEEEYLEDDEYDGASEEGACSTCEDSKSNFEESNLIEACSYSDSLGLCDCLPLETPTSSPPTTPRQKTNRMVNSAELMLLKDLFEELHL